ncbi:MAG: hypothetical protein OXG04_26640 [Acidobacteria bacterium]|nr:hypothetical protein [Acidobacteriota bacterium]
MNKDRSLAHLSFSLNASISRSGVVNAPMPNGADDNDRGWMEPTDSFIEFQGSAWLNLLAKLESSWRNDEGLTPKPVLETPEEPFPPAPADQRNPSSTAICTNRGRVPHKPADRQQRAEQGTSPRSPVLPRSG